MNIIDHINKQYLTTALKYLSDISGFNTEAIKGKYRKRELCDLRKVYCKAAKMKGYSLHLIGNVMNRSHCLVIHNAKKFDDLSETDVMYKEFYNKLYAKLINSLQEAEKDKPRGLVYLDAPNNTPLERVQNINSLLALNNFLVICPYFTQDVSIKERINTLVNECSHYATLSCFSGLETMIARAISLKFITKQELVDFENAQTIAQASTDN